MPQVKPCLRSKLREVKTVALQNHMDLDLLLAGGTCKAVDTECCSYISDATTDVMDMVHDTWIQRLQLGDNMIEDDSEVTPKIVSEIHVPVNNQEVR